MNLWLALEALTAAFCLFLLLLLVPATARAFIAEWHGASKVVRGIVLAAFLSGAVLRFGVASPSILYTLPDAYFSADRLFFPLGIHSIWHPMHGMGAAVVVASAGLIFGPGFGLLSMVNAAAGFLVIPMAFLFGGRLIGSRLAGAFAAWVLAVHVPTIRVDVSDQAVALSALTFLLAGHWVLTALRERTRWNFVAAAVAVGAAAQFRMEYLLHLGALALIVVLSARTLKGQGRNVLVALGVLLLLAVPRSVTTIIESATNTGFSLGATWRWDVTWELFAGGANFWLNPRFTSPVLVVLVVLGLCWLVTERRFVVALYFVSLIGCMALFCFNEWMLDFNDTLRFQANLFVPFAILSGAGLSGLVRRLRPYEIARPSLAVALVLPLVWVVPEASLLREKNANDHEVEFLARHGSSVPDSCPILVQGASASGKRSYRTGWRPGWLVGREQPLPRFPEELSRYQDEVCSVVFIGVDCYRWYGDELLSEESMHVAGRAPLRDILRTLNESFDRSPPPLPRKECAGLFERYAMEPIVTAVVPPARRGSAWEPVTGIEIGMYRLHSTQPDDGRDAGGDMVETSGFADDEQAPVDFSGSAELGE